MKLSRKDFRVKPKTNVRLKQWPTHVAPAYELEAHYEKLLRKHHARLSVSKIADTLRELKMTYPPIDAVRKKELQGLRAILSK